MLLDFLSGKTTTPLLFHLPDQNFKWIKEHLLLADFPAVFFFVSTFSETLSFLEGLVDQGKVEVQVRGTIFFPEKKTFLQLFAVLQLRK